MVSGLPPSAMAQRSFVTPQQFGARAYDAGDDTRAFQAAVDAAAATGQGVRVPAGTYWIDATANPTPAGTAFGGVQLPSRTHLRLEAGAVLQAIPNASAQYAVLRIIDADDVLIEGSGTIRGERHAHLDTQGEWGIGILVWGGWRVRIEGVHVEDCWGDGVLIMRSENRYAEDVVVTGIRAYGNRRQGISVVSARRVLISNVDIRRTQGTPPSAGIDLEPDSADFPNEDITIRGGYFSGNEQDILMVGGNRNILIDGPTLRSQLGIVVRDGSYGVRILNADIYASAETPGTGAIKVIAQDASTIRGLEISRNSLKGGEIVLDIPYPQVRNVVIRANTIWQDHPRRAYRVEAQSVEWADNDVRE